MTDNQPLPEMEMRNGATCRRGPSTIEDWLVGLLACPADQTQVHEDGIELVCDGCGRRYPVRDGIPMMIVKDSIGEHKF
jgi:uncharacterized protein YbaR (Trm112 family)